MNKTNSSKIPAVIIQNKFIKTLSNCLSSSSLIYSKLVSGAVLALGRTTTIVLCLRGPQPPAIVYKNVLHLPRPPTLLDYQIWQK